MRLKRDEVSKCKQKRRYIKGFDGIRGVAVLAVILYHLVPHLAPGGYLGVVIFFVLSGYLITDLSMQEYEQTGKIRLKQFWERRLKRLLPALLSMLVVVTTWITLFEKDLLVSIRGSIVSALLFVNNWWQIANQVSYFDKFVSTSPFTHLWSLSVEVQFYLVWPILLVLGLVLIKNKRVLLQIFFALAILSAVLMAVLYQPQQDPSRIYYGTDTRVFSLLIGGILALVWPSNRLRKANRKAVQILDGIGFLSLGLLILMMIGLTEVSPFVYLGGMFIFSLITAALIGSVVHPSTLIGKFFSLQPLKYIGLRSYGLYLWQYPVMILYEQKVNVSEAHPFLSNIIQLILIFGLTEISYQLIEKPLQKLSLSSSRKKLLAWPQHFMENGLKYQLMTVVASLFILTSLFGFITAPKEGRPRNQELIDKLNENSALINQEGATKNVPKEAEAQVPAPPKEDSNTLTPEETEQLANKSVTAIGDSVMIDVADQLKLILPNLVVDGEIGRQLYQTVPVIESLKNNGKLGDIVLLELGTNGAFTDKQLDDVIAAIGERQIYMVNIRVPKNWQAAVNDALERAKTRHPNLTIIDWYKLSEDKKEFLYGDGVHPNTLGSKTYANMIAKALLENKQ